MELSQPHEVREKSALWRSISNLQLEGDILVPVSRPGHRGVGGTCLLHGFVNEQLPHCTK